MMKEFRDFILTGNVIEFAVAVIMAGAIGAVITGFVDMVMMPIIGELVGGMDFSSLKYVLSPAQGVEGQEGYVPENAILWGKWINTIINLVIVGWVLFLIVRAYNKARGGAPTPEATEIDLLTEIRDLLREGK